ncbi:MAG: hypothetical protein LDL42_06190 [Rhizobium sp.]|nr:hypothetical protein [Rhizobium sp.]
MLHAETQTQAPQLALDRKIEQRAVAHAPLPVEEEAEERMIQAFAAPRSPASANQKLVFAL